MRRLQRVAYAHPRAERQPPRPPPLPSGLSYPGAGARLPRASSAAGLRGWRRAAGSACRRAPTAPTESSATAPAPDRPRGSWKGQDGAAVPPRGGTGCAGCPRSGPCCGRARRVRPDSAPGAPPGGAAPASPARGSAKPRLLLPPPGAASPAGWRSAPSIRGKPRPRWPGARLDWQARSAVGAPQPALALARPCAERLAELAVNHGSAPSRPVVPPPEREERVDWRTGLSISKAPRPPRSDSPEDGGGGGARRGRRGPVRGAGRRAPMPRSRRAAAAAGTRRRR